MGPGLLRLNYYPKPNLFIKRYYGSSVNKAELLPFVLDDGRPDRRLWIWCCRSTTPRSWGVTWARVAPCGRPSACTRGSSFRRYPDPGTRVCRISSTGPSRQGHRWTNPKETFCSEGEYSTSGNQDIITIILGWDKIQGNFKYCSPNENLKYYGSLSNLNQSNLTRCLNPA